MLSAPSVKSAPPTIVCPDVESDMSTVSSPACKNSSMEPLLPLAKTLSFSVPPSTVPVLPTCSTTVSLPLSPVTVADPVPCRMLSSPASPTMVPGPLSPDWFNVSFPAVPVAL